MIFFSIPEGQQAMAVAMLYPEGQKGKKVVPSGNNFSRTRLSLARTVLRYSQQTGRGCAEEHHALFGGSVR
jgi:hypothetical protein